ncbi:probable glutathione S-transferase 9 isoform X2 [Mercenaria mercenaria]|uniref:probable glutathione S-transferase 9 isoform X2 n=1 Tax=Mercenaria mercenaria TaxID=6596 RepID=UPI00234ED675|nr:probable glutathione S-transferase 9 isoform X2 [Mercenaria mercenaria]
MPKYKLIYFDIRGRAEIPRLLLTYTGIKFEDKRLRIESNGHCNEWIELKSKMPQKVLPVLEVDGKQLSQSLTICRYLAREFGLCGKTNWEQAQVEQVVDTMDDLRAEVAKWIYEKDTVKKDEIASNLRSEIYPKFFGILETILRENEENNNRSGYFVGDHLTLADLSVFETFTFPLSIHPDIFDDHLELQEHRQRIMTDKHLAEYIKNRPERPV